jgi:hypothetical protein
MDEKLSVFVKQIKDIVEFLKPHINDKKKGRKIWNGKKYAEYCGEEYEGDSYGRLWYSTLIVLAEMIDRQESKLTRRQKEFISRFLFGGMGSFNDYSLRKAFQKDVSEANQELDTLRGNLYATFEQLNVS